MKTKKRSLFLSVMLLLIVLNSNAQPADVIMWYDCDNGALINSRPDNGWWYVNPEYPGDPTSGGPWRTTTSLLGKYESQDATVIKQHAYWIKASGCNVIACDLTNSCSPGQLGLGADMKRYCTGVNMAFQLQLDNLAKITEFDAPTVYPTVRLGTNYSDLTLMLNDMYALFQTYPSKWYKLADGTADNGKPFIVIFIDGSLLNTWAQSGIPAGAKDSRFNIRYSNGYLLAQANITQTDGSNYKYIPASLPFWFFVENTTTSTGYYKTVYKNKPNGTGIEQMITWASVNLSGSSWDGLRDLVNGVTPIVRYSQNVSSLAPQVLLANRFNYAIAWMSQPQEGVSRNKSTHIEPNVDWGFTEFNEFASEMFTLKNYAKIAPPTPRVYYFDNANTKLKIKLDGYPTEYRISNDAGFSGATWTFLNVGTGGIPLSSINQALNIYVQTRNGFGTSQVGKILKSDSNTWSMTTDDQDFSGIRYSGGNWQTGLWSGYYNASCQYANASGSTAIYTFTGTGINWIAATNTDHGKADVYIDGTYKTTVDQYSTPSQLQHVVYTISSLTPGQHTIYINATGTKNASATGTFVDIDAFIVTDANTSTITIDDMNTSSIIYGGNTWEIGAWSYYYNNSCHYSGINGSTATYTFTGTGINWIAATNTDHGKAEVYIDGVYKTTVDQYSASGLMQQVVYSISSLSNSQHTILVHANGTKNASATGTFIDIDAFQILGGLKSASVFFPVDNTSTFSLSQNNPNPFNTDTRINYNIQNPDMVTLKIYNIAGKEVATLINQHQEPGSYTVHFDASKLKSGIYVYKLQAGDFSMTKKMALTK